MLEYSSKSLVLFYSVVYYSFFLVLDLPVQTPRFYFNLAKIMPSGFINKFSFHAHFLAFFIA